MIDLENVDLENVDLSDAERAAYSSGDTLKAKLLARIMDLEDELERVKYAAADDSLEAWEDENGPANAYMKFFFDCFKRLRVRHLILSITSETHRQIIFDALARGEGS